MALNPLVGINRYNMIAAHGDALVALNEAAKTREEHWYPCGFAWVCVKIRKNHAMAQTLRDIGWKWDDYRKHYYFSMAHEFVKFPEMSQSMNYRERCLQAYVNVMRENGVPCHVETRID